MFNCRTLKSGKNTLPKKILINHEQMIEKFIVILDGKKHLMICKRSLPKQFKEGLPDIEDFGSKKNNLLIFDDLMRESCKDTSIYDIFTVDLHHKNECVFFLTQNSFPKEK